MLLACNGSAKVTVRNCYSLIFVMADIQYMWIECQFADYYTMSL